MEGFIQTHGPTLIIIGGIFGVLGTAWRGWVRFRRWWEGVAMRWDVAIELIETQLQTNHGTSMMDKVNKIEPLVERVEEIHERMTTQQEEARDAWAASRDEDAAISQRQHAIMDRLARVEEVVFAKEPQ